MEIGPSNMHEIILPTQMDFETNAEDNKTMRSLVWKQAHKLFYLNPIL